VITSASTALARPRAGSLARLAAGRLPLLGIFAAAVLLAGLESFGHRTALSFSDELLYSKYAQGIAAGTGTSIWGVHQFFPAPLLPLVQAPVWLLGSVGDAYLAARLLNGVLMAAAVFPAYWLARRLVRHEWALLAAAAAVAVPELGYHDLLMAEPLAYPLFLLAAAAIVRAVADGSRAMRALAVVSCALVALTRLQLAAVALGYLVTAIVCSPRRRAHALPLAVLLGPPLLLLAHRGHAALGQYNGFIHLHARPAAVAHWIALMLLLLPFSTGLAVLPGALLGLADRPRNRAEAAFVVFTLSVGAIVLVQAALVSAGDAQRTLTRYVFYLAPLFVIAFFLYAERGAPRRLLYVSLAAGGGLAAARIPFAQLTGPGIFDSEAPAGTVFAALERRFGIPTGTLVIELGVLAVALLVALVPLRRAGGAFAVALASIAVNFAFALVYAGADHRTTRSVAAHLAPSDLDWIDASGFGRVTYLSLPDALVVPDSEVEFWNRSIGAVAQFSSIANGALPLQHATISAAGRLEIDGKPNPPGRYVVGSWGSRIGLDGRVLGHSSWLTALALPRGARVRWLAQGLDREGWSGPRLDYTAWRRGRGRFTLRLSLPAGTPPKTVVAAAAGGAHGRLVMRGGTTGRLVLPAAQPKLTLTVTSAQPGLRERGVRVDRISFRAR
jgi:hypothetical protein